MEKNEFTAGIYEGLDMEEAISHRVHSRIFEILGYLDLVERNNLPPEEQVNINRIEDLCKTLVNELHSIIDFYKGSEDKDIR